MNRLKLTLTVLAVVGITVLIAALKWQRKRKFANMNLITDFTEVDFSPNHPELHHYVDLGGLEGIFKNQTMWATQRRDHGQCRPRPKNVDSSRRAFSFQ
jgi:hypothetical protein